MTGILPVTPWAAAGDVKNRSRRFFMTGVLPVTRRAAASDVKNRSRRFFMGDSFFLWWRNEQLFI
ncbi:hypothetical protein [Klebsiella grimontii]|uniref:hypothetical protein n=1 Tax=Klebsiella grimontii TaxID=2058152 RepID=UPI002243DB3C|nr:hypothetical protein [Klebsiella grimontii]